MHSRNKEPNCNAHSVVKLVEIFARQVLNDYFNVTGTLEIVQPSHLFSEKVERVNAKKYSDV